MFFILILVILFFLTKKESFSSLFVSLSFLYFCFFYAYPLYLLADVDNYYYAGYNFSIDIYDIVFAVSSSIALLFGFALPDLYLIVKKRKKRILSDVWNKNNSITPFNPKFKIVFYVIITIVIIYLVSGILDTNRATQGYDVRAGISEGSWAELLLSIFINTFFFSMVYCLIFANKNKFLFILFSLSILYMLTGSTGRMNLVTQVLLFMIFLFKLKPRFIILTSVTLVLVFMPIIINMKGIIYSISVDSELPNLIEIYKTKPDISSVVGNFGHPLVSLLEIDGLINITGFRFFYDYLQGILFYLKALGLDFGNSITYYNTENILGFNASVIPPGYLAFGYIQLGYIGIIVSGAFYRIIGLIAEFVYYSMNIESNVIKIHLALMAASTFYHGEVRIMVMTFFIPLFIFYFLRPLRLIRYEK